MNLKTKIKTGKHEAGSRTAMSVLMSAFAISSAPVALGETRYSVTVLDDPGSLGSHTAAINNRGTITGTSVFEDGWRPVVWRFGAAIELESPCEVLTSGAAAINNLGRVVGSVDYGDMRRQGCLWDRGNLVPVPGPSFGCDGQAGYSTADAINDAGWVVGTYQPGGVGPAHAFLWASGIVTDLGDLPGGSDFSQALDVNSFNQVVGSSLVARNGEHAFLWEEGTMIDLGVLESFPGYDGISVASALNDSGQVVGWSMTRNGWRAFLWEAGAMTDLGAPQGFDESEAQDINNSGQVVVDASGSSGSGAFIWDAEHGMRELNSLLDAHGEDWHVAQAAAINDRGQIVGTAYRDGQAYSLHSVLLTPVRPLEFQQAALD